MPETRINERFGDLLNRHGFGFQAVALRQCDEHRVSITGAPGIWRLRTTELPVELKGEEFHVDGVVELFTEMYDTRRFVIVECKRSSKDWCFVRSRSLDAPRLFDLFTVSADTGRLGAAAFTVEWHSPNFDRGFEVKGHVASDAPEIGKGLKEAITQAFRGSGGFAEHYAKDIISQRLETRQSFLAIPLIVTTADLYTSNVRLDSGSDRQGNITADLAMQRAPWAALTVNRSRSLRPDVQRSLSPTAGRSNPLEYFQRHQAARTIVISSIDGLGEALDFLALMSPTAEA